MTVSARALGSRYELESELGSGAMGRVWRARDRETGEAVAAKVLHDRFAADVGIVTRFLQERTFLLTLDHPNIVRVRDLVVEGNQLAIVMDLVDGSDLRAMVKTHGLVTPAVAAELIAQTLDGLAHAHAHSVLHRDVKPDNILLDRAAGGCARLSDFSIARLAQETTVRMTGLLGTADYMAPEVFSETVSAASDVYGAGITLYELLAGFTPFSGSTSSTNPYAVARRHETAMAPRIPGLPDGLWQVINAMLTKSPQGRPTAAQAAAQLHRLLPSLAGLAALPRHEAPDSWDRAADALPESDIAIRSATAPNGPVDPQGTLVGEASRVASPVMPVAGEWRAAAEPVCTADHPVTELGPRTVPRPVVDVPELLPAAGASNRYPTWVKALVGSVGLAALIGGGLTLVSATGNHGHSKSTASGSAVSQSYVFGPSDDASIGLSIGRKASYDASTGLATVIVTWTAKAPVAGPFLESIPPASASLGCPFPTWQGDALGTPDTAMPLDACAEKVRIGKLTRGQQVTAQYTVLLNLAGNDKLGALAAYLTMAREKEISTLEGVGVSSAYAAQRLTDLRVGITGTAYQGALVPVTVSPVWLSNGTSPSDSTDVLFSTDSGGATAVMDQLGGAKALTFRSEDCPMQISSGPSGPRASSAVGPCTITAQLGGLSQQSRQFTIYAHGI